MLKRIVAGLIMLALGLAIATVLPKATQPSDGAATGPTFLDRTTWKNAKLGDEFLLAGRVHGKNRTYDKGLVIGRKDVWKTDSEGDAGWSHADEYRQILHVDVSLVGRVEVTLDSTKLAGTWFVDEQPEKERYIGVKMAQKVVTPVVITELRPQRAKQLPGEALFVGTPDEWRAAKKKSDKKMTYIFYFVGGLLVLGGGATVVSAFGKKDQ